MLRKNFQSLLRMKLFLINNSSKKKKKKILRQIREKCFISTSKERDSQDSALKIQLEGLKVRR